MKVFTINLPDRPDRLWALIGSLRHSGAWVAPPPSTNPEDLVEVIRPFDSRVVSSEDELVQLPTFEVFPELRKGVFKSEIPFTAKCFGMSFLEMLFRVSSSIAEWNLFLIDDMCISPPYRFQQLALLGPFARQFLNYPVDLIQLHPCFKPPDDSLAVVGDPFPMFTLGVAGSADQGLILTRDGAASFLSLVNTGVIPFVHPDNMVQRIRSNGTPLNERSLTTIQQFVEPLMFDWDNSMTTNRFSVSYTKEIIETD